MELIKQFHSIVPPNSTDVFLAYCEDTCRYNSIVINEIISSSASLTFALVDADSNRTQITLPTTKTYFPKIYLKPGDTLTVSNSGPTSLLACAFGVISYASEFENPFYIKSSGTEIPPFHGGGLPNIPTDDPFLIVPDNPVIATHLPGVGINNAILVNEESSFGFPIRHGSTNTSLQFAYSNTVTYGGRAVSMRARGAWMSPDISSSLLRLYRMSCTVEFMYYSPAFNNSIRSIVSIGKLRNTSASPYTPVVELLAVNNILSIRRFEYDGSFHTTNFISLPNQYEWRHLAITLDCVSGKTTVFVNGVRTFFENTHLKLDSYAVSHISNEPGIYFAGSELDGSSPGITGGYYSDIIVSTGLKYRPSSNFTAPNSPVNFNQIIR